MKNKTEHSKILREIHQENVSLDTILEFRLKNENIPWTELIYNKTGDSILHIAARLGQEDIVNYIVSSWSPKQVDIRNNDCKTPLHEAAQFSQGKIAKILLDNGAQVDAIKRADWTPLMLACTKCGAASYETVQCISSRCASVQLVNKDGWTPLHVASRTGDIQIVKHLLQINDKIINCRTNNGRTLLHIAALHGNLEIVQLLLEKYEINVNSKDKCGNTPFHDGVCSANIDVVKMLVAKNCDVLSVNNAELQALHLTASEGLVEMTEYLVKELKLDPNVKTSNNVTALHCAARKKQRDVMHILINLGADESICDSHGRLAADYLLM
ncbi:Ankyrin 2 [Carabus blaptoides fortunei]